MSRPAARRLSSRSMGLSAFRARIVLIVGVFLKTLIEGMANFGTADADEVNPLDRFVDALAIENAAFELLNPDAEQVLILTFNLAPASFVLWQISIFFGRVCSFGKPGVQIAL